MGYPIGIDLGTTNSVACVWRPWGLETIPVDGRSIMPSAISVRSDGSMLVGHPARARAHLDPANSVLSAKRWIGDGKTRWEIGGGVYEPKDISALILGRLRAAAETHLGEPVTEAVISTPAYFNNNQKRDTRLAGEAAGLRVLQMLPEPTAAAMSYGLDKGKDQTILVYDLGGGTFDVSVLRVEGNRFTVMAVDGDFRLGGDDFDNALSIYLVHRLPGQNRPEIALLRSLILGDASIKRADVPTNVKAAEQQLREASEIAKIELSESSLAPISLPNILGGSFEDEISLDCYNGLIAPLVGRTIVKIKDVLKSAHMTADDIDRVVLAGGSTRNRLVREQVTELLKEPWTSEHVDEAVARGAAIMAGYLALPGENNLPIEVRNVTPFGLGVRASTVGNLDAFKLLIPKNTRIPATFEEIFTTYRDNQSAVHVAVFQGEADLCRDNTFIGGFRLDGIPPARMGLPSITVRFQMDASDMLTVTAVCETLETKQTLDINQVSLEDTNQQGASSADIMFLIDTSGSMTGELTAVKELCLGFAAKVIEAGVDCSLGLMDFAKPGSAYKWEIFPPMPAANLAEKISILRIGRLGFTGCYIGEPETVPVIEAFAGAFPNRGRTRAGILISDEVRRDATCVERIVNILNENQIPLYVVGVSNSCHETIASKTGGRFWDIVSTAGRVDLSGVLSSIAVEITHLAQR